MASKAPYRFIPGGITAPKGFLAAGVQVGIKYSGRKDLALIYAAKPCVAAGVFTTNYVKAAPVRYDQKIVTRGRAHVIVANSGCANACTGRGGYQDTVSTAKEASERLDVPVSQILVCSTGSIGSRLPMDRVKKGIREAVLRLSRAGSHGAAQAIITTDTFPKEAAVEFSLDGEKVRIGAIAKGSGMINPTLATMLCFISTDLRMGKPLLQKSLREAVSGTFNQITVDNEQSTNDTVLLLASGASGILITPRQTRARRLFQEALTALCSRLAQMVARDGEGATRMIEVKVRGARNRAAAERIAKRVAGSDLVKSAVYGKDPNVGRVLAAVGSAGVLVNPDQIDVWVGNTLLAQRGVVLTQKESRAKREMQKTLLRFIIDLHAGSAAGESWGCDLTEEYVRINARYRT